MRKVFIGVMLVLSIGLLLMSGCAKDQVKPDQGIADTKVTPADSGSGKKAVAPPIVVAEPQAVSEPQIASQQLTSAQLQAASQQLDAEKLPIKTIYFDFDSYALSQAAREILSNNADYLLKKYKGKVKLEGHCDERGSDEYNLALGENRAKSALNYLLTLGVPADQLSIISYGKERPADDGHTEEAWAKNRRVEFTVIK